MTNEEMFQIVESITYKPGWKIGFYAIAGEPETEPYVQLEVTEESDASLDACKRDGVRTPWKSGKRFLSQHMCRQEVVGTVFGLIEGAEKHEMREWFRYKGASIYNPHLDPDELVKLARKASSFNVRENSMTMEEGPPEQPKIWWVTLGPYPNWDECPTIPGRVIEWHENQGTMARSYLYKGTHMSGAMLAVNQG